MVSTDQADPIRFFLRISWILMERRWFHCPLHLVQGLRSLQHWLTHTLLPNSLCSLEHFTSKWHGTLCFPTHFAPQHTLLPDTLYSSAHFTPQHTLLQRALFSLAHFASKNTLLPRTLCFLCSREQSILWRTFYKGAKCSREQSVLRSKVFQEAKCAGEQSV
jgi:hypothetical protein